MWVSGSNNMDEDMDEIVMAELLMREVLTFDTYMYPLKKWSMDKSITYNQNGHYVDTVDAIGMGK